jgi:pyridoxamine 5'-phosphate oxidase
MSHEHLNTAADWPDEPMALFSEWLEQVKAQDVPEPEAMALCTTTADGKPSARMVLLRGLDDNGFRFYTNYESRKGQELVANPHAAAVFYWRDPYLQVRIEGEVEKVTPEESDEYFNSRNRAKRVSAVVSQQSRPIEDFRDLLKASDALSESDEPIDRPSHWGGFRIKPTRIEFWAGTQTRMHRRCIYTRTDADWNRELQAP